MELNVVEQLVQAGDIVITVGGGGIPVIETPEGLKGVASVIDKDRSSAKLALDIKADMTPTDFRRKITLQKPDGSEEQSGTGK